MDCVVGGLDCRVTTTEYRTRVHCIDMSHLLCNALVHVIYSRVSGQCSHAIPKMTIAFMTLLIDVLFLNIFQQCNDVCLMAYLGTITKGCNTINQVMYHNGLKYYTKWMNKN